MLAGAAWRMVARACHHDTRQSKALIALVTSGGGSALPEITGLTGTAAGIGDDAHSWQPRGRPGRHAMPRDHASAREVVTRRIAA